MTGTIPRVRRSDRHALLAGPAAALLLLLVGVLAACSGGNGSPSSSTTSGAADGGGTFDTASAAGAVKQTWTTFFSQSTPIAQKETLLQDGTTTYAPAAQAFASNPMVGEVTADVQNVAFSSPTQANVTYSISLGGQVVENSMAGKAVYQNGKWLVADTTLCGLLQLAESQSGSAASIPGCG
jgi:hypothetical protein